MDPDNAETNNAPLDTGLANLQASVSALQQWRHSFEREQAAKERRRDDVLAAIRTDANRTANGINDLATTVKDVLEFAINRPMDADLNDLITDVDRFSTLMESFVDRLDRMGDRFDVALHGIHTRIAFMNEATGEGISRRFIPHARLRIDSPDGFWSTTSTMVNLEKLREVINAFMHSDAHTVTMPPTNIPVNYDSTIFVFREQMDMYNFIMKWINRPEEFRQLHAIPHDGPIP